MNIISFINEEEFLRQKVAKCSICENEYVKHHFIPCTKCTEPHCPECTYMAGKLGNICKNCYAKLTKEEQENISSTAKKLQFWANHGYYLFLFLMGAMIFSFGLILFNGWFLLIAITLTGLNVYFGIKLYEYLSQHQ